MISREKLKESRLTEIFSSKRKFATFLNENEFVASPDKSRVSGRMFYLSNYVLLKENVKRAWLNYFFTSEDGLKTKLLDSPILTSEGVLKRSGHLKNFVYLAKLCKNCSFRVKEEVVKCLNCDSRVFGKPKEFSLLFRTEGSSENLYLRPETTQGALLSLPFFPLVKDTDFPFLICQSGKSFRNEITLKSFIKLKEFEQLELEYFFLPKSLQRDPELNFKE